MLQLHNILTGYWGIHPVLAYNYLPIVASFIKGDQLAGSRLSASPDDHAKDKQQAVICSSNKAYKVGFLGSSYSPHEIQDDAVAVISITGAITKYSNCENYGSENYANLLAQCYANDFVKGIVLILDSPGGEARAMRIMTDALQMRNKPVVAYASDACYSAAFGIASQCDAIFCNNEFSGVGSIGTMMTIMDQTEYFEKQGIRVIDLYANASSKKNQEYRDIISGNTKATIAKLDAVNEFFLNLIETGRGDRLTADRSVWGTGETWTATEALKIGIIDGIATLTEAIDSIV